MNFIRLLGHLLDNKSLSDRIARFKSLSGRFANIKSLTALFMKLRPLSCHLANIKPLSSRFMKLKSLSSCFVKSKSHSRCLAILKSLSGRFLKLNSRPAQPGKFKIENVRGRHVAIGGLLIYLLSFMTGIGTTGIALDDAETPPDHMNSLETTILNPSGSVKGGSSSEISDITMSGSMDIWPMLRSTELTIPATFLKKIFLNNLGLNIIIIAGAFSLLAFSMIVLVFNALQVGMLVKGIYNSYGLKLATTLVLPHLLVEVASHILSLYIAYLIMSQIIVPVVVNEEGFKFRSVKNWKIPVLFMLMIILTFIGALVEIYVTPKLI